MDLQKISKRTLIHTNVVVLYIPFLYSKIYFQPDIQLLEQGSTVL